MPVPVSAVPRPEGCTPPLPMAEGETLFLGLCLGLEADSLNLRMRTRWAGSAVSILDGMKPCTLHPRKKRPPHEPGKARSQSPHGRVFRQPLQHLLGKTPGVRADDSDAQKRRAELCFRRTGLSFCEPRHQLRRRQMSGVARGLLSGSNAGALVHVLVDGGRQ